MMTMRKYSVARSIFSIAYDNLDYCTMLMVTMMMTTITDGAANNGDDKVR